MYNTQDKRNFSRGPRILEGVEPIWIDTYETYSFTCVGFKLIVSDPMPNRSIERESLDDMPSFFRKEISKNEESKTQKTIFPRFAIAKILSDSSHVR